MNIKNRIKRIETARHSQQTQTTNDERHGISLDQWRRHVDGADILAELPESKRPAFLAWRERCEARRREAAATAQILN